MTAPIPTPAAEPSTVRASAASARRQRDRRLALSILTAVATRPIALVVQLLIVPALLAYLGRERYGIFEAVSSIALWAGLANAGLSLGLLNSLIECYVTDDRALARRQVASTLYPMVAIVVVLGLAAAWIVRTAPLARFFPGVTPAHLSEVPTALLVAILASLAAVLASVPAAVYTAHQENHRNNAWDALGKVASLGAVLAVAHTRWGLTGALFAAAAAPVLTRWLNGADLFLREKPWLRPRLRDFDARLSWRSFRQSLVFFALQVGVVALFQTDKVIVSTMFGATAAANYALVAKVFLIAYGALSMLYIPLWPGHGEAVRRGDLAWVARTIRLSLGVAGIASVAIGGAMLLVGGRLLHAWLHADVAAPASLCCAFTAMFALRAWVDCRSVVLNASGILRPQLAFFVAQTAAFFLFAILLGRAYGAIGVAWAGPAAALVTTFWGYPWMIRAYVYVGGGATA